MMNTSKTGVPARARFAGLTRAALALSLCLGASGVAACTERCWSLDRGRADDFFSSESGSRRPGTGCAALGSGTGPRGADARARPWRESGNLSHQLPGEKDVAARSAEAGAHFRAVAENIAYGPDPNSIERQWMHSVPHRSNILDPRMNAIGIAVVAHGGQLWAVEDFSDAIAAMTPADVEGKVGAELGKLGITLANEGERLDAARAACPGFEGTAGARARFVVRWESGDLSTLPGPLMDAVHSGQYSSAAVGACAPVNARNASFTSYRVAVLLF